jgi:hypothetical protein
MYISLEVLGSMVLDVSSNRLDAYFINTNSVELDRFTIIKDGPPQTAPTAPFALATRQVADRLLLRWADRNTNETGFRIQRSTDKVHWRRVGATGANTTNFLDSRLAMKKKYYYRVRAFNAAGQSRYSKLAAGRLIPQPALAAAKFLPERAFPLVVNGPPGGSYLIERSTDLVSWSPVTVITNTTNTTLFYSESPTNTAPQCFYRARLLR